MGPDRHDRITDLYHAALACAPEQRRAFLIEACGGDEALRKEVESLLAYEPVPAPFLDGPAAVAVSGARAFVGTRLGPYEIVALLGAGGMGEVYRAHDTTLGRDVAVKILPPHLTADSERRTRFAREARLLATLNHPHIGAIYGVQEADGQTALILELVDGPTLANRLQRGPLPIPDALAVARQIAEALEAAHERGIVHRDLKPANIVLQETTGPPRVKVLDFGLAKAMGPTDSMGAGESFDGTADGRILGTPAYMSPEQARGRPVDKRTDIWAFGCVLYEMLTGRPAFAGDTISDTVVSVLEREPDWAALPAHTPINVRTLLQRCLRKDPQKRLHDIADATIEIEDASFTDARMGRPPHAPVKSSSRGREWLAWGLPAALGAALLAVALAWRTGDSLTPRDIVEFGIDRTTHGRLSISPDGRHVAFASEGKLWVRSVDNPDARMLAGTEGANYPFWKPDGSEIGFFAGGLLKTVRLDGGVPVTVCRGRGQGTWNQNDVIVFGGSPNFLSGDPLRRVPARGGEPGALTSLQDDEFAHGFPFFLPDGDHFLYLAQRSESSELRVASLTSTNGVSLGPFESNAEYAAGHIFFVRHGSLLAQPFDADAHKLTGSPSHIAANIAVAFGGLFSVSARGLAYTTGGEPGSLTWFDRRGKQLGTVGDPGFFMNLDLSPDEQHLAASRVTVRPGARPQVDLWRIDLASGLTTRLTDAWGWEWDPSWSPDGSQIAFNHAPEQGGRHSLYVRPADASGTNTLLADAGNIRTPDWSHDGRQILYTEGDASIRPLDLWILALTGERRSTAFLETQHYEGAGIFAPDDRWIAYESDASGRREVYVRPFPAQPGEFPISRDGGRAPRWRGDGKEIFFLALDGTMMSVDIDTTEAFRAGVPTKLFPSPIRTFDNQQYVVTKDGQRFLMTAPGKIAPIVVLLNWQGKL